MSYQMTLHEPRQTEHHLPRGYLLSIGEEPDCTAPVYIGSGVWFVRIAGQDRLEERGSGKEGFLEQMIISR